MGLSCQPVTQAYSIHHASYICSCVLNFWCKSVDLDDMDECTSLSYNSQYIGCTCKKHCTMLFTWTRLKMH